MNKKIPFYEQPNFVRPTIERYMSWISYESAIGVRQSIKLLCWLMIMGQYETYEFMNDQLELFKMDNIQL